MENKLNELIKIYKECRENECPEYLNILKNDIISSNSSKELNAKIKSKISYAEKQIIRWLKIIENNPSMVFTGKIGLKFYNSIFYALINGYDYEPGFSSKSKILEDEPEKIQNLLKEKLVQMLNSLKKCNSIEELELLMKNLRYNLDIVGAR